jgi:NADH dehydrogenase (ubiquinone) 1 alpha subcomplex subunit 5
MRAALRLFASVKPGQFLEAGTPTGLTGLLTHPSPRSTLLYNYNSTLDKLKQMPESSVYRQSTEALTRHRLKIIQESIPAGWKEWTEHVEMQIASDPDHYKVTKTTDGDMYMLPRDQDVDTRSNKLEWDGEEVQSYPEGIRSMKDRGPAVKRIKGDKDYTPERAISNVTFKPEPQYTAEA